MKARSATEFEPPLPILAGSDEERFERHRHRFLGLSFDLDALNRTRAYVAFKAWHHRALQELPGSEGHPGKGARP